VIVLDTHAWLWFANDDKRLSKRAKQAIRRADALGVSIISVWETAILVAKGRLRFDDDVKVWIHDALTLERIELLQLTPDIAMTAASFGSGIHADPADRIIIATALAHDVAVVTKDGPITDAGLVRCVW
jgi:PIN domain nuclease of toxin-antitoxin system